MKTIEEIYKELDEIRDNTIDKSWSDTFRVMAEFAHSLQTPEPQWLPIPDDRCIPKPSLTTSDPFKSVAHGVFWFHYSGLPIETQTHYCQITIPQPMPKPDAFEEAVARLSNCPAQLKAKDAAISVLRQIWDAAVEHTRNEGCS